MAPVVEDFLQIRTRELYPAIFEGGTHSVQTSRGNLHVSINLDPPRARLETPAGLVVGEPLLDLQPCHFGGHRAWFLCPACGARRLLLIVRAGEAKCRRCHGLYYRSSQLPTWERHAEERERLEEWLADPPKWTHASRYQHVLARFEAIGGS